MEKKNILNFKQFWSAAVDDVGAIKNQDKQK